MPGLMSTLYTSYSGMSVSQTNIQTTSHNINNMNTPGYTRQKVVQTQRSAYSYPGLHSSKLGAGQVGQGVQANDIIRIRNSFNDFQFRNESHDYGEIAKKYENYTHMESIFNEPSDSSISSAYNDFYMAWHELSKLPGDAGSIDVVVQNSKYLAQNISSVTNKLEDMKEQIDKDIRDNVDSINSNIDMLRALELDIKLVEGNGKTPNDLYDERDRIIDELSFKMDLTKEDTEKFLDEALKPGKEVVYAKDGAGNDVLKIETKEVYDKYGKLVGTIDKNKPIMEDTDGDGIAETLAGYEVVNRFGDTVDGASVGADAQGNATGDIKYVDPTDPTNTITDPGTTTTLDLSDCSGELQGSSDMIKNLDSYINTMKQMAETLVTSVNDILNGGDGTGTGPFARELFTLDVDGNIKVSDDAHNILGAIPHDEMVKIAKDMYDLKDKKIIDVLDKDGNLVLDKDGNPKKVSLNNFYNDLIQRLGNETQQVKRDEVNQSKILNNVESSRLSVTGVSLDEEMVNLVQFQHSYNASAKVISTIDSLLEVVINGLKR